MKFITTLALSALVSFGAMASDDDTKLDEANKKFAARGQGDKVTSPTEAAKLYGELAVSRTDKLERAKMYNLQSNALYWVGKRTKTKKDRMTVFEASRVAADNARKLLDPGESDASDVQLANALINHSAALGKWAEAKGVLSSLGKWPTLRKACQRVIDMGQAAVQDYGAHRILGRAYHKLPKVYGGKKKALKYLQEGYDNTLNADGNQMHGQNAVYLADTLKSRKKKTEAKAVLESFLASVDTEDKLTKLNPRRTPELREEIVEAQELLKTLNKKK